MLESIAFIPDGNRRYASSNNISFVKSYLKGTKKAWDVLEWLSKYPEIKTITFYTLSIKNLQRPKVELKVLMKIFGNELKKVLNRKEIVRDEICIKFIGQKHLFSQRINKQMTKIEECTSCFNKKRINIAFGYDGQTEIIDAAQDYAFDLSQGMVQDRLTIDRFRKYLYSDFKDPDLIVRTSKEQRLSGFLTFQSAYSELAFIPKFWPEITKKDIDKVIKDYNTRNRRFGK